MGSKTCGSAAVLGIWLASPAAASDVVEFHMCNATNEAVVVAISYRPIGYEDEFLSVGWSFLSAGQCSLLAKTDNRYVLYYAESDVDPNTTWSGSHWSCVEFPGPYEFWITNDTHSCESYQSERAFKVLDLGGPGIHTERLTY